MVRSGPAQRRFFTTTDVARYCEVSNDGVLKWIKAQKLRAFATPGGHYRVSADDFREFLFTYAFPIQESFFEEPGSTSSTTRVLIVDDEADQREILRRGLRRIDPGWIVDEAADGYDAGIKIGTFRPDVVLLDLMMPRIDGLSLCRSIRNNPDTRRIRIIVVTADTSEEHRSRAARAGADAYLRKPVDFERLRSEMQRQLAGPSQRPVLARQHP